MPSSKTPKWGEKIRGFRVFHIFFHVREKGKLIKHPLDMTVFGHNVFGKKANCPIYNYLRYSKLRKRHSGLKLLKEKIFLKYVIKFSMEM